MNCMIDVPRPNMDLKHVTEIFDNRLHWYLEAKFGLFIHWGAYTVAGAEAS